MSDNSGAAIISSSLADVPLIETLPFPMEAEETRVLQWVTTNNFTMIAMQFPDELLRFAPTICLSLQSRLPINFKCFVLGDTSFGSCCVDVGAAQHLDASCVIHYGRACLTSVHKMPVLNVFPRSTLKCPVGLADDASFVVFYNACFLHDIPGVSKQLPSTLQWTEIGNRSKDQPCLIFGRSKVDNVESSGLLFLAESLGDPLLTLMALRLYGSDCPLYAWINDSETLMDLRSSDSLALNRKLTKRFSLIERARDADSIGVLVSMTSTKSGVPVMNKMKNLVKSAGKKPYLLVIGKINEPKLFNWPHLEVYCLLSCPFTSLEVCNEMTTKSRAVITPYELQLACAPGAQWSARWLTELQDVIRFEQETQADDHPEEDDEAPQQLSSAIVAAKTSKEIVQRIMELSPATRYLQQKATWTGLDPVAPSQVELAVQGRSGTARNYAGEGQSRSAAESQSAPASSDHPNSTTERKTTHRPHIELQREPSSESVSEDESEEIGSLF